MPSIEERLKKMEDVEEIRNLRMLYHSLMNEGHFDRVAELFTDDANADFGPPGKALGKDEIRDFYASFPSNVELIVQFIHNHMVEVTGDEATGLSYMDARLARDGQSIVVAAKLEEKYRRMPDGWKISEFVASNYFAVPLQEGWAGPNVPQGKPFTRN